MDSLKVLAKRHSPLVAGDWSQLFEAGTPAYRGAVLPVNLAVLWWSGR
jgi:hypothetical protein